MIYYLFAIIIILILIISILFYKYSRALDRNGSLKEINQKIQERQNIYYEIENQIKELEIQAKSINNFIDNNKDKLNDYYETEKAIIDTEINLFKQNCHLASEKYFLNLEKAYSKKEQEYDNLIKDLNREKDEAFKKLNSIKATLAAAIDAQLREQKKIDQVAFYSLQLDEKDIYEITALKSIEKYFRDPRPLRMVTWSHYYSKKANELCGRILKKDDTCGIYKITLKDTNKSYIGQAIKVKDRLREHMKYGLGIDTPAKNLLYKDMQEKGLDSFTFELLEECPKEELNQKEKFYIDLYSSYTNGYNSNKGVSKNG